MFQTIGVVWIGIAGPAYVAEPLERHADAGLVDQHVTRAPA